MTYTEDQWLALRRAEAWVVRRDKWGRVRLYDVVCGLRQACRLYGTSARQPEVPGGAALCEHYRFGIVRREIDIWPSRACMDIAARIDTGTNGPPARQLALAILGERFDWAVARQMRESFYAECIAQRHLRRDEQWTITREDLNTFWATWEDRKWEEKGMQAVGL